MKVINISRDTVLADKAEIASTFIRRLIGLLNRQYLNQGEALILMPSDCIHSFFMRFTIDALFLDRAGKVIGIAPSFKPFRLSPIYFNSKLTIELPEHTLKQTQTQLGDIIQVT
jgi:uncharacterized membrane protein (UPF0127 family)